MADNNSDIKLNYSVNGGGSITSGSGKTIKKQLSEIISKINKSDAVKINVSIGNGSTGSISDTTHELSNLTSEIKSTETETNSLFKKIKDEFSGKLNSNIMAGAVSVLKNAITNVYKNVLELDSAITNLQITTGKSKSEAKEMLSAYSALGKELGTTTTDVVSAADGWLKQGYEITEVNELIKGSVYLSKLGQIETSEATTALTSALNGYKLGAESAVSVVDKLTAVDMEAAASADNIAAAISGTASSARTAGVDIDTLIGYLTAVKEVTQDSDENVGNFANTMFSRMTNIESGNLIDPATGESLSDVETVLDALGIKLRSSNQEFKAFDDILSEVGDNWNSYTAVQQQAIATAFAGTEQQEKFLSLMNNFGKAMDYAKISTESAGSAAQKYESSYINSMEASINNLTTAFQTLSSDLLDSGTLKGLIDLASGFVGIADGLAKTNTLIPLVAAGILSLNNIGKPSTKDAELRTLPLNTHLMCA